MIHPKNDKILDNNRREKPTIDDDVAGDAETILDEYEGEFIAGKAVNFATNWTGCDWFWWFMLGLVTTERTNEERRVTRERNSKLITCKNDYGILRILNKSNIDAQKWMDIKICKDLKNYY